MALSAVEIGTADGGSLLRPLAGRSPASTSKMTSPTVAGNWVGRLVDPVTQELAASGVVVSEVPVVEESKREGEIMVQNPTPGQPLRGQATLTMVRNPGTIDLLGCCVHFVGLHDWEQKPAVIGRQPYDTTLRSSGYWSGNTGIAIPLSAAQRITRLTAVIGIPNDSSTSSDTQAIVVVKIDGTERKRETITVVNSLPLDLSVADVARVELLFVSDSYIPVVVADLIGHQG